MLVDMKCGKSQGNLVLQLRGKPLLYHYDDYCTDDYCTDDDNDDDDDDDDDLQSDRQQS